MTDRQKLHDLLLKAGSSGVNSLDASYILNLGKQVNARKWELQNKDGCVFETKRGRKGSAIWIHLGCKGYVAPVKPVYVPEWQQVDNRVQVWSVKLGRYTWEVKKDPEQIDLLTATQQ